MKSLVVRECPEFWRVEIFEVKVIQKNVLNEEAREVRRSGRHFYVQNCCVEY